MLLWHLKAGGADLGQWLLSFCAEWWAHVSNASLNPPLVLHQSSPRDHPRRYEETSAWLWLTGEQPRDRAQQPRQGLWDGFGVGLGVSVVKFNYLQMFIFPWALANISFPWYFSVRFSTKSWLSQICQVCQKSMMFGVKCKYCRWAHGDDLLQNNWELDSLQPAVTRVSWCDALLAVALFFQSFWLGRGILWHNSHFKLAAWHMNEPNLFPCHGLPTSSWANLVVGAGSRNNTQDINFASLSGLLVQSTEILLLHCCWLRVSESNSIKNKSDAKICVWLSLA